MEDRFNMYTVSTFGIGRAHGSSIASIPKDGGKVAGYCRSRCNAPMHTYVHEILTLPGVHPRPEPLQHAACRHVVPRFAACKAWRRAWTRYTSVASCTISAKLLHSTHTQPTLHSRHASASASQLQPTLAEEQTFINSTRSIASRSSIPCLRQLRG